MKLMFASDIHGSEYWCSRMMERYAAEAPLKLILLGDLLYHGPRNDLPRDYNPKGVIAQLNSIKEHILAVRGN
ncbi:MAG: phosphodiesterase, partial [Angelakisella sp.]